MRVLVCNLQDAASCNIRDRLLEQAEWSEEDGFRAGPVRRRGDAVLVEVGGPSVTDEALDGDLRAAFPDLQAIWFLSKHVAKSGQPSLTVHPNGNPGDEARFGGQPGVFSTAAPRDMSALLRALRHEADAASLPHQVTFEATHHGPLCRTPALFVEIGSDATWYDDRPSGEVLAKAVLSVLASPATDEARPVLVGVGGGHYVPRQTDKALAGQADFGHLLPAYTVTDDRGPEMLAAAVAATPDCAGVYLHKKGLKGPQRQMVKAWCEELGIDCV